MRRALASWASSTLRGAHAESVVALSVVRCFATESEPSATGTHRKKVSPRQKRYAAEDKEGVKSKLYSILKMSPEPLSAADMWESAEPMGVKSKRFMKLMLQNMKSFRYIKTVKTGKGTQMGYILPENMNPKGKGVPWPMPPMDPSAQQQQAQQEAA